MRRSYAAHALGGSGYSEEHRIPTVSPVATGPWRFATLSDSTRPEGLGMGTGCCAKPTPYSILQQGARAGPPSTLPMQGTKETIPTSLTPFGQVPQHPPYPFRRRRDPAGWLRIGSLLKIPAIRRRRSRCDASAVPLRSLPRRLRADCPRASTGRLPGLARARGHYSGTPWEH